MKVFIAHFHGHTIDDSLIFVGRSEADLDTQIVGYANQFPFRGRIKKPKTAINLLCDMCSLHFEGYEERKI